MDRIKIKITVLEVMIELSRNDGCLTTETLICIRKGLVESEK